MRTPKYQYPLYGLYGEFMGVTTRLAEAQAHKAKLPDIYYYRRYEYDADCPDWSVAKERGLTCTKGKGNQ